MTFLFSRVIAPAVPADIVSRARERAAQHYPKMNTWGDEYANRELQHPSGNTRNSNNRVIYLDDPSLDWAKEDVTASAMDIRVFASTVGRHRTGPHTDRTRQFSLIYLLEGGSEYHSTVFYKDKNTDLIEYTGHVAVNDYSQLDEIARLQLPCNAWTLLNARVLHSIENIGRGRLAIQISLNSIPSDLALVNTVSVK